MPVTVKTSSLAEDNIKASWTGGSMEDLALGLAKAKASSVLEELSAPDESLVIGADQILVMDGERFDKPRSIAEAADHLRRLSGNSHKLISACSAIDHHGKDWRCVDHARLTMRSLSEGFIQHYLEQVGEDALQSVGCYQLEGVGVQLFERVEGDYFTILGLPLLPLLAFLRTQKVLNE